MGLPLMSSSATGRMGADDVGRDGEGEAAGEEPDLDVVGRDVAAALEDLDDGAVLVGLEHLPAADLAARQPYLGELAVAHPLDRLDEHQGADEVADFLVQLDHLGSSVALLHGAWLRDADS